jgi:hypothetical protein
MLKGLWQEICKCAERRQQCQIRKANSMKKKGQQPLVKSKRKLLLRKEILRELRLGQVAGGAPETWNFTCAYTQCESACPELTLAFCCTNTCDSCGC